MAITKSLARDPWLVVRRPGCKIPSTGIGSNRVLHPFDVADLTIDRAPSRIYLVFSTGPGIRMMMTGRFVNHGIRITVAISLLLAVTSSPIRPSKPFDAPTDPHWLPRNFAITTTGADHGDVASSRSSATKAGSLLADVEEALDAEREDELRATSQPSCAMFDVLPSPCFETHRELIGRAVERATRPLRC